MNVQSSVDLSSCAQEPIHIIGRIQSFGFLVSFSSDWIVNHVSANCAELLGKEPDLVVGSPATEFLAGEALHEIRTRLQMLGSPDSVERIFGIDLRGDGRLFDVAIHSSGRSYVLEAEPTAGGRRKDYAGLVRPMVDRLRKAASVDALCDAAARQLRGLTGFDRVMVYRFEGDGAGEVVAESLRGTVDSYKGLHFPASDIPAQARRLYTRNILRIISDVDDPTVPIVPATNPAGEPLDLSMSGLRAVSPIHIEYLRNMGVKASMSVSIMRRGELWGLMACHHYAPLQLSYSVRTAAELFGEFLSFVLEQADMAESLAHRDRSERLHDEIMGRVAGGSSLLDVFDDFGESIGKVIPHDGIVGWIDGEYVARGKVPGRDAFAALARFLNTTGSARVWTTDNLEAVYPPAADYAGTASGLLSLPVSRSPRDYVVLFREEHLHSVDWAGNPEKPVELGPNGARLTPRKSFDLWKEERRGFSHPWTREEVATAENLRVTLLEVILRMSEAASIERDAASRRQDTLIAELNHRVRNILNLIRGLVAQSRSGVSTVEEFAEVVGDRICSLARAHDQVTRTNWSASSLFGLIDTECQAYVGEKAERLSITGIDALVTPVAFSTLALVFHELMTNSCKYGAFSDRRGSVTVRMDQQDDGWLAIEWREADGPAVKPPSRRGFGSSIIERAVPHELGGFAEVDFARTGLVMRMRIPGQHIAAFQQLPTDRELGHTPTPASATGSLLSGEALVVEDNMIIAMEAEDILTELGATRVHVAASVRAALETMAAHPPSFALLDINLGRETSEPVARALVDAGVPFAFASGYGEDTGMQQAFPAAPVIAKPYSLREVQAVVSALFGG